MTTTTRTVSDPRGMIFIDPVAYSDQEAWHAVAEDLRENAPVLRVEAEGYTPFWAVTRYEDVFDVSRHNEQFLNTRNSVLGPDIQLEMLNGMGIDPKTLIHMDGEEHRQHRGLANAWFRPRAVSQRQAAIDAIADQFVAKFRDLDGRCDFAQDIAVPYTLRVIMSIFGVPEEDEATMLRLTQGIFGAADPEYLGDLSDPFALLTGTIAEFEEYFNELAADRRAHPADDLATVIANGTVGGCPMDRDATLWYFTIVATAGHDTTSFALSGGLEALLHHPEQFRLLQQDPSLVTNATEEMIRWTSPVRHFLRYLTEPAVLSGVEVPAGDRLLLSYPSANRDHRTFDDPMTFDVTRANANRTLAFGGGEHFCLGSTFARREIRTIVPKLLAAVDEIVLDGEPEYAQANFVGGVKHLPVTATFR
ncbi:MAG: cytochrome P450 [Actinomycetota bacterium]|nr:cytochrome P450 [Actinomycetota bacterium]MDA8293828.1 cytochrome P450 [Actinomycetota bacterium]